MFDEPVKKTIFTRSHKDHKENLLNFYRFSLRGFVALCETKTFYDLINVLIVLHYSEADTSGKRSAVAENVNWTAKKFSNRTI
jgi:hypothetical protein